MSCRGFLFGTSYREASRNSMKGSQVGYSLTGTAESKVLEGVNKDQCIQGLISAFWSGLTASSAHERKWFPGHWP